MDADDLIFAKADEAAAIEERVREALGQMEITDDKIQCVKKKLERLEAVKKHLKASFESRVRKIEVGGQYAGRWRRSEVVFNSILTGTVKDKADRLEVAVEDYVQGPLDPVMEGVDSEGLKSEIRVLIDLRKQALDRGPILDFPSLVRGWVNLPSMVFTQPDPGMIVIYDPVEREAPVKEKVWAMLVFLVLFLMEPEEREEEYRKLVTRLEVEKAKNPTMPLISKFLSLLKEARLRCGEMTNLRRITRNILECYSSMVFLEGEVNEFLEILVESMEHLDFVLRDVPQRRLGDCIILQFHWGWKMMNRFDETVESAYQQMLLVYGPCFLEWDSVIKTWTRAALAT